MEVPVRALITGATGQDGSYLIPFLLDKGYEVHGIKRRCSNLNTQRIDHLFDNPNLKLHYGDMTDGLSIHRLLGQIQPDEIYNLAAQSHVAVSFEEPEYTANADALGPLRILESVRLLGLKTKIYQASTSEMFGAAPSPQNELTPTIPQSPYGAAKVYAYHMTNIYRTAYKLWACNGILFNHESPTRGETFVTRKVTQALAAIKRGSGRELVLGNLEAKRDWGHASDFIEAMWLMLQRETPKDYVISTGEQHTVREFIEECCRCMDIPLEWRGDAGYSNGDRIIRTDPKYLRPSEVPDLCGDSSLARLELGWKPKVTFKEMVKEMCNNDLRW